MSYKVLRWANEFKFNVHSWPAVKNTTHHKVPLVAVLELSIITHHMIIIDPCFQKRIPSIFTWQTPQRMMWSKAPVTKWFSQPVRWFVQIQSSSVLICFLDYFSSFSHELLYHEDSLFSWKIPSLLLCVCVMECTLIQLLHDSMLVAQTGTVQTHTHLAFP